MVLLAEHILVVLGVMAVALAMVLALQQRRAPQSSAAWVLFIILLPYVAVPVFLMLGFRKARGRVLPLRFLPMPGAVPVTHPLARALTAQQEAPAASGGNALVLHETPGAARDALDEVIAGAARSIDALFYIVAPDDSGRRFITLLTEKAQVGVRVRLSLDALGSLHRPRAELATLAAAGGEVRVFAPLLRWRPDTKINLRNHRKLLIADGQTVWAGGRNIADDYLTSAPGVWEDLSFSARGPVVQSFADIFAADWGEAPAPLPPSGPKGDAALQLMPAGPDDPLDLLHDALVTAIHRADRRVWIATPYFLPTEPLALALASAARRGVEVHIHLPAKSNQWTADLARGPFLREMAAGGCRILRHAPGMLHAKAGLVDDAGWIGSANFDVRSMLLNYEFGLMAYDAGTVAALERWFHALLPLAVEGAPRTGRPRRLIESIFRLGAPIL